MTLYIVHGFSKAVEFGVEVPKDAVVRAFGYLHRHYLDEIVSMLMAHDSGWEFVTFLNYTHRQFPRRVLDGRRLHGCRAQTDARFLLQALEGALPLSQGLSGAYAEAGGPARRTPALVWASVMDSAKTTVDEGTSWAPEDRGWLWYNDTIETHAFALRTLMELEPADARSEGLVQWLFLNKKLNHWKSTRATSEVIYSVAWFLKQTGALGVRETVTAEACGAKTTFTFEPDKYTGKKNQLVIAGDKLGPECATVKATKGGKGMAFASATWHFSTDKMPEKGDGDLFAVDRTYFKREKKGEEVVLRPLAEGAALAVGDEIEVQPVDPGAAPGRVRPPEGPAAVRVRAGDAQVGLQVGPRARALRGDPGQRHELLHGVAARGRVHADAPDPVRDGRDVQGRAGDAAVDVRPRVRGLFRRRAADDQVDKKGSNLTF